MDAKPSGVNRQGEAQGEALKERKPGTARRVLHRCQGLLDYLVVRSRFHQVFQAAAGILHLTSDLLRLAH
jgi:hypothetical protein